MHTNFLKLTFAAALFIPAMAFAIPATSQIEISSPSAAAVYLSSGKLILNVQATVHNVGATAIKQIPKMTARIDQKVALTYTTKKAGGKLQPDETVDLVGSAVIKKISAGPHSVAICVGPATCTDMMFDVPPVPTPAWSLDETYGANFFTDNLFKTFASIKTHITNVGTGISLSPIALTLTLDDSPKILVTKKLKLSEVPIPGTTLEIPMMVFLPQLTVGDHVMHVCVVSGVKPLCKDFTATLAAPPDPEWSFDSKDTMGASTGSAGKTVVGGSAHLKNVGAGMSQDPVTVSLFVDDLSDPIVSKIIKASDTPLPGKAIQITNLFGSLPPMDSGDHLAHVCADWKALTTCVDFPFTVTYQDPTKAPDYVAPDPEMAGDSGADGAATPASVDLGISELSLSSSMMSFKISNVGNKLAIGTVSVNYEFLRTSLVVTTNFSSHYTYSLQPGTYMIISLDYQKNPTSALGKFLNNKSGNPKILRVTLEANEGYGDANATNDAASVEVK